MQYQEGENKEPLPFLWTCASEEHDGNDFGGLFDKRVFIPSTEDGVWAADTSFM